MTAAAPTDAARTPERALPGSADAHTLVQHVTRYAWALEAVRGLHALDLGCGAGYGTEMLSWTARSARGYDLWRPAPGEVRPFPGVEAFVWGHDLCADPLPAANVGVLFEVLEHLAAPRAALELAFAAVDRLVLSFPNPRWHGSHHNPHHVNDWTLEQLRVELTTAAARWFDGVHASWYSQAPDRHAAIADGATGDDEFWIVVADGVGRRNREELVEA